MADTVKMSAEDRRRVRTLRAEWNAGNDEGWEDIWSDLTDILDAYAPPYCYVGSIEGDGADIGVWVSWDAVDQAVADGEITKGDTIAPEATYRLSVSDHGNAELYDRSGRSVWAIV